MDTIPLVPAPDHIKSPRPPETAITFEPAAPEGWWSIENMHGTREGVLKALAVEDIPEPAKAYIKSLIDDLKPEFNFVKLDAHFTVHGSNRNLSASVISSSALV